MHVLAHFYDEHNAENLKNTLIHVIREVKKLSLKEEFVREYSKEGFKRLLVFIKELEADAETARRINKYDDETEVIPDALIAKYRLIIKRAHEFYAWDHSLWHYKSLIYYTHAWTITPNFQRAEPTARYKAMRDISNLANFLSSFQEGVLAETINFRDWLLVSQN